MKKETALVITMLYAIFTLIAIFRHEIWTDEAQAWQLCKYLTLGELTHHLSIEGHPIFFYLLIFPFAKLSPNIVPMQIICWLAMCGSVFLLFRFSPFNFITKCAITLSAGFIYFLPVIARSYSILPFLIFSAAILYEKQKQHPILYAVVVSSIACTHVIMLCFSVLLFIKFVIDNRFAKKSYSIASIIMLLSFVYVFWQIHNSIEACISFNLVSKENLLTNFKFVMLSFFKNAYNYSICTQNANELYNPIIDIPIITAIITAFIGCFITLLHSKKLFVFTFLTITFQLAVYILYYPDFVYVTRIFTAFTIIIFSFWILLKSKNINQKIPNILIATLFILTSYNGFYFWLADIKNNFSGSKESAEYIKENINNNSVFLIANEAFMVALKYYLNNYKFLSVCRNNEYKYITHDEKRYTALTDEEWEKIAQEYKKFYPEIYVIRSHVWDGSPEIQSKSFEKIFQSQNAILPLDYFIVYKYLN